MYQHTTISDSISAMTALAAKRHDVFAKPMHAKTMPAKTMYANAMFFTGSICTLLGLLALNHLLRASAY